MEEELCKQCRHLNLRKYLAPERLRLFWSLPMAVSLDKPITTTSQSTCGLCQMLAAAAMGSTPITELRFETCGITSTFQGFDTAAYCLRLPGSNSLRISVLGKDSYRLGARKLAYGRIVKADRVNVALARNWLRRCERFHRRCSALSQSREQSINSPQFLVDAELMAVRPTAGQPPRYLALSYV